MSNKTIITGDPAKTLSKAKELLEAFDTNLAMTYFWAAGEEYAKQNNWGMAGYCLFQSAYCYELDERFKMAAEDYKKAAEYYRRANLAEKAQEALFSSENARKKKSFPGRDKPIQTIVVGAVGLNGSGKDMLIKRLNTKYRVPMVSFGDIARDIAAEENIQATRDNLHDISVRYFAKFGFDYFAKRVIKKIEDNDWFVAGVSGIRTPADVQAFEDFYGGNFLLVLVEVSDPKARFDRMKLRAETRDPQTYEAFLEQDRSEAEIFKLEETIKMAKVKIMNDGTLDDFNVAVDELAVQLRIPQKKDETD